MSLLFALLLGGASFGLMPEEGRPGQFREPANQFFERPILAFNDDAGHCVLRFRERTTFEDWQKPGFSARWFKLEAWTSCEKLRFRDVLKADYEDERVTPGSNATFKDVGEHTLLVSVSGAGTEIVLFFDRGNRQREIWVSD